MFVLPSVLCAYISSIPILWYVYGFMFKDDEITVAPVPQAKATIEGIGLGFFIPIIGSIVPISNSLKKQISESITNTRSKTKGQKVSITDANSVQNKIPYLIFGGIGTFVGMLIYYVFPMAVLNFELGLLLEIFFMILIGMILGLTLISFNLQRSVELIILHTLFFFETKSMKILITKNLSAHREANRLTSIIYSLTLGCIIFVIVASSLQISLFSPSGTYGNISMSC